MLVDRRVPFVNNVVVKDRVLLAEEGLGAVVLTVDQESRPCYQPGIISRGFIYMR